MTENEREWYEERAAIREYMGGYDRAEAERLARGDVILMRAGKRATAELPRNPRVLPA